MLRRAPPFMTSSPAALRAFVVRSVVLAVLALPLAFAGCGGSAFSAGSGSPDGSVADGAPDGDIIVGPGRDAGHDGASGLDASHERDASEHEDATAAEAGRPDSGSVSDGGADAGCASGDLDCNGTCTPQSLTNCGSCGHDCSNLPHVSGTVTCGSGGVCTFTNADCASGWAHCTSNPDDGCETSTAASPNCGGCGVACSGGTPVCNGTACVSGCSGSTPTYCPSTSTCVNTTDDPQNCSGCGDACPAGPANSTPSWSSSACGWACNTGYSGCPAASPTSCQNLSTDTNNCGTCANVCPGPVAGTGTTTCSAGSCGVTCTGSTPNECGSGASISCVNESSDVNNCGTCNHICPAGPSNSTTDCSAGSCGWTCNPNYELCGGTSCVLAVPDATAGVFVAQGGAMSSCGSVAAPCGSVTAALAAVAQSGGTKTIVYVAESSTPYIEQVTLPAGVTIQGGWTYTGGGQWAHPCALDPTQTVIQAPAGDDRVIIANFDGTSTLETLEVSNPTTASAGESLYGVFVTGANTALILSNVSVHVAAGGAGIPATGTVTNGMTPSSCSSGTGVGAGTAGTAGTTTAGGYSASGYAPGNGGPGGPGGSGANGTAAPAVPSPCTTTVTYCKTVCPILAPPYCTQPSQYECGCGYTEPSCPTAGTNGCGGTGGSGGNGGNGGGASVGVFVGGSSVVFQAVAGHATALSPGAGGNGSNGQTGGTGGGASDGTAGNPGINGSENCSDGTNGACVSCTVVPGTPGGAKGGNGLAGGAGGTGGGGAGGDSLCYATFGSVSISGTPTCNASSAGVGGNQGLPNQGPAGNSGLTN